MLLRCHVAAAKIALELAGGSRQANGDLGILNPGTRWMRRWKNAQRLEQTVERG